MAQIPSGENLEENVEFAHVVGTAINQLIDGRVLSTQDVSDASDDTLFEFVQRFETEIKIGSFSEKDKEKLKTLFSSKTLEVDPGPNRERLIDLARSFLTYERQTGMRIKGIILFGSRMDPSKKARFDSDLDMILVLDLPQNQLLYEVQLLHARPDLEDETPGFMQFTREDSFYADLDVDWKNFCRKNGYENEFNLIPQTAGLTNIEFLLKELELETHLPFWGYFPNTVYFVGDLENMSEEEVNEHIQKALRSPKAKNFRQELLDKIKARLTK